MRAKRGTDLSQGKLHLSRWNLYLLLAASAHFALFYTLNTRPMLSYPDFEAGREVIPYQYRALTALIMKFVSRHVAIPARVAGHLPPSMHSVEDFTLLLLTFVSLLAACFATRAALKHLSGGDTAWSAWGALLVIPMCYYHYLLEFGHPCCTPMQLPYDLPSVAFFACGIWLIVTEKMAWFYPLFVLSTLNRESTVFLILILLLYRSAEGIRSRKALWVGVHCLLLGAIWMGLRVWVHRLYPQARPSGELASAGDFVIHVKDNLGYLFRPYYWTSFLSLFGFTWIFVYRHWREVPGRGLRRALWIGPIYFAAMYVVGVLSEIRIFGELIALFVIAFVLLVRRLVQDASGAARREGLASQEKQLRFARGSG